MCCKLLNFTGVLYIEFKTGVWFWIEVASFKDSINPNFSSNVSYKITFVHLWEIVETQCVETQENISLLSKAWKQLIQLQAVNKETGDINLQLKACFS